MQRQIIRGCVKLYIKWSNERCTHDEHESAMKLSREIDATTFVKYTGIIFYKKIQQRQ